VFSIIRHLTRQGGDRCESGQALVEYTLILTFIALVAFATLETIGPGIKEPLKIISDGLGGA